MNFGNLGRQAARLNTTFKRTGRVFKYPRATTELDAAGKTNDKHTGVFKYHTGFKVNPDASRSKEKNQYGSYSS